LGGRDGECDFLFPVTLLKCGEKWPDNHKMQTGRCAGQLRNIEAIPKPFLRHSGKRSKNMYQIFPVTLPRQVRMVTMNCMNCITASGSWPQRFRSTGASQPAQCTPQSREVQVSTIKEAIFHNQLD